MSITKVKAAVRERDGFRCTKCGVSNEDHLATHGKSLHVHRLTPGSVYTLEGCVTLCIPCHVLEPKRKSGTRDLAYNFCPVRIRPRLAAASRERVVHLAQSFAQYVNDALRMRLESEGRWPPP